MYPPLERRDWNYEHYPSHKTVLPERAKAILISLRNGAINSLSASKDNRDQHEYFFADLTPKGHSYFAGHYRGENFPGLQNYEVEITGDRRVGVHSSLVEQAMDYYSSEIETAINVVYEAEKLPVAQLPKLERFLYSIRLACKFFVEFLRVHPYANGNGHMGRFLIFSFLGLFGIWPKKWPLNDRPPDPPYSKLIHEYRNGNCNGLEKFVIMSVIG